MATSRSTGYVTALCGVVVALCVAYFSLGTFAENPRVVIETSMGEIEVELFESKAPLTVANFLSYTNKGFYEGTVFHRVIDGFMIQGGGMGKDLKDKKTDPPIKNESTNGLKNDKFTVAMARTPRPDSATSQFFINLEDNPPLNREKSADKVGYCVFGKVTKGFDVVEKIAKVKTGFRSIHEDVPVEPIFINRVRVVGKDAPKTAPDKGDKPATETKDAGDAKPVSDSDKADDSKPATPAGDGEKPSEANPTETKPSEEPPTSEPKKDN